MNRHPQILTLLASAVASALLAGNAQAAVLPAHQTGSSWFTKAASEISAKAAIAPRTGTAKNVILFVGDGMGVSTLTAARIYQGQQQAGNQGGEENRLSFENFPYSALAKTYSANQQTSDSAPTMTAMITGVKTKDGLLSVSSNSIRANCASSKGNELVSAFELAEAKGKATGVVSTARVTHATPAATMPKVRSAIGKLTAT